MALLVARKISKSYGRLLQKETVLYHIDVTVEQGEFLGIMGPSGSGKTTLLQILAGIEPATEGLVEIKGQSLQSMRGSRLATFRREEMGFVFQQYNLLGDLTILGNIMLPFALTWKKQDYLVKAEKLAEALGIGKLLGKYPYQVSGGEQQRTTIARALVTSPSIVFADEPTGALDSKAAAKLMEKFRYLHKHYKQTILMVTHDGATASHCSRVLFLKDGQIYTELYRGEQDQQTFYNKLMATQAVLGGDIGEDK